MKKLKKYISIYRGIRLPWFSLIVWTALSVAEVMSLIKTVNITANIIDASQKAIKSRELIEYILYLALTGCFTVATVWFERKSEEMINLRVREKLWGKIMRLKCSYYDADNGDQLVTRVSVDAGKAYQFFSLAISSATSVYGIVVIYLQLFQYHAGLAARALLLIPVTLALGGLYSILGYKAGSLTNRSLASAMAYLAERTRNLRLVKAFGMEQTESETGNRVYKRQFRAETLNAMSLAVIQAVMQLLNCAFLIIAFVGGVRFISTGDLTVGRLVGFYSMSGVMSVKLLQLFMNMGSIASAAGSLEKISEIMCAEDEFMEGRPAAQGQRDISIRDLCFSYTPEIPVLSCVTCTIPAGKTTAVIGANGAGKSTIFKMLLRMYDPDSGGISYGGDDISSYSLDSWRGKFAVVAQDAPLLSGTVRDNITYGIGRDVSDDELFAAAKAANAYDFIMEKPSGFQEEVGVGGGNFSGGQRQCIALARAMLLNADILLLDEATSNLDVICTQQVQTAVDRLAEGRTTVVIAHTCAATSNADYIIVMRDGAVEDAGTPGELLTRNEYYRTFLRECGQGSEVRPV